VFDAGRRAWEKYSAKDDHHCDGCDSAKRHFPPQVWPGEQTICHVHSTTLQAGLKRVPSSCIDSCDCTGIECAIIYKNNHAHFRRNIEFRASSVANQFCKLCEKIEENGICIEMTMARLLAGCQRRWLQLALLIAACLIFSAVVSLRKDSTNASPRQLQAHEGQLGCGVHVEVSKPTFPSSVFQVCRSLPPFALSPHERTILVLWRRGHPRV
jgi:hypothetical protein